MILINIIGYIGLFFLLFGYFLNTLYKNKNKFLIICKWFNLFGSLFILINSFYLKAFPSFFLNVVWFIVALISILYKRK